MNVLFQTKQVRLKSLELQSSVPVSERCLISVFRVIREIEA